MKENWDATFNQESNRIGGGIVIKDEYGEPLVLLSCNKGGVSHPLTTKIWTLWRGLKLCDKLNFTNMVFEIDALVVIKAINSEEVCWTWYGQLIEDIHSIIRNRKNWLIQYTCRDFNNVAHTLANIGLKGKGEMIWIEECPHKLIGAISSYKIWLFVMFC